MHCTYYLVETKTCLMSECAKFVCCCEVPEVIQRIVIQFVGACMSWPGTMGLHLLAGVYGSRREAQRMPG